MGVAQMTDLSDFPASSDPRKVDLEQRLIRIEFFGLPDGAASKSNFIVDLDFCTANCDDPTKIAVALENLLLRTPAAFDVVKEAVEGMKDGSSHKRGGFDAQTLKTLRAAITPKNIDPKLGTLRADSTLPERLAKPPPEVLQNAARAKKVLAQIDDLVGAYAEFKQANQLEPFTIP
jgi:hypothetical protein